MERVLKKYGIVVWNEVTWVQLETSGGMLGMR
jgi:hypothetical protein